MRQTLVAELLLDLLPTALHAADGFTQHNHALCMSLQNQRNTKLGWPGLRAYATA